MVRAFQCWCTTWKRARIFFPQNGHGWMYQYKLIKLFSYFWRIFIWSCKTKSKLLNGLEEAVWFRSRSILKRFLIHYGYNECIINECVSEYYQPEIYITLWNVKYFGKHSYFAFHFDLKVKFSLHLLIWFGCFITFNSLNCILSRFLFVLYMQ